MTVTPTQALARARTQSLNGPRFEVGYCLRETRKLYGVPARYSSAAEAFAHTKHRISGRKAGALVWWTGGSHGDGHVALDIGDGYCWSVDIRRHGYFDRIPVETITREWGLTFAGRSLDINDVQVVPSPAPATPNLDHSLSDLRKARDARKPGPVRTAIGDAILKVIAVRDRIKAKR